MPLSLVRLGTSAGYGVLDIATEYVDQTQGMTKPFENITDWQRAIAFFGGAAGTHFGRSKMLTDVAEATSLSSLPLLEKSVANAVLKLTGSNVKFNPKGGVRGQVMIRRPGAGAGAAPGGVPGTVY